MTGRHSSSSAVLTGLLLALLLAPTAHADDSPTTAATAASPSAAHSLPASPAQPDASAVAPSSSPAETLPPDPATPPPVAAAEAPASEGDDPAGAPGWQDTDGQVEIAARGSIETCEAITFPLVLLPGVGDVIGMVLEWACLVPGVLAVQYVETHHGERALMFWQPALALVLAKAYRELVTYPALALAIGAGVAYAIVAVPALVVAPYFIPVGISGLLSMYGLGYVVYRKVRNKGADWIFETSYSILAGEPAPPAEQLQRRADAWVQPPLTGWPRTWALLAAAAGAEPRSSLENMIPVIGPWNKAQSKARVTKAVMRQTARETLQEPPRPLADMDSTIDTLAFFEGGLGAAGQALLLGGLGLFTAGSVAAGLEFMNSADLGTYAVVATTSGFVGIGVAGTGLALVLLREIPKALWPFVIPMAYGGEDPTDEPTE